MGILILLLLTGIALLLLFRAYHARVASVLAAIVPGRRERIFAGAASLAVWLGARPPR